MTLLIIAIIARLIQQPGWVIVFQPFNPILNEFAIEVIRWSLWDEKKQMEINSIIIIIIGPFGINWTSYKQALYSLVFFSFVAFKLRNFVHNGEWEFEEEICQTPTINQPQWCNGLLYLVKARPSLHFLLFQPYKWWHQNQFRYKSFWMLNTFNSWHTSHPIPSRVTIKFHLTR